MPEVKECAAQLDQQVCNDPQNLPGREYDGSSHPKGLMPVALTDSLAAYLAADTAGWAGFARTLSEELASWIPEQIEASTVVSAVRPEMLEADHVHDELLTYLLSPQTVRQLLFVDFRSGLGVTTPSYTGKIDHRNWSKKETHTRADLADYIINHVTDAISGEPEDERSYKGFRRMDHQRMGEAIFGQVEVSQFIERVAGLGDDGPAIIIPKTPRIACLDTLDVATYRMLQTHPELLRTLNWRFFERLLADLLERSGYTVELRQGTKDGGIDLFAIKQTGMFGRERYLLQAKRWQDKVGVEPVRQLAFLHQHHHVTKSCLATTSTFTEGALQLAEQYEWQLELRDYQGLQQWVGSVQNKIII